MAICDWCKKEMTGNVGTCEGNTEVAFPNSEPMAAIPYPLEETRNCHDCNVAPGGYHHPGCDMERCPKCGGQLISCGCLDDEDDEENEEGWL